MCLSVWKKACSYVPLRSHPELSSFSREYTEYAGGKGVKGCRMLFKMLITMHCIFIPGSPKSTFSEYSFGREGVTIKSTLCTLLIMLIIIDDPLGSKVL